MFQHSSTSFILCHVTWLNEDWRGSGQLYIFLLFVAQQLCIAKLSCYSLCTLLPTRTGHKRVETMSILYNSLPQLAAWKKLLHCKLWWVKTCNKPLHFAMQHCCAALWAQMLPLLQPLNLWMACLFEHHCCSWASRVKPLGWSDTKGLKTTERKSATLVGLSAYNVLYSKLSGWRMFNQRPRLRALQCCLHCECWRTLTVAFTIAGNWACHFVIWSKGVCKLLPEAGLFTLLVRQTAVN